MREAPRVVLEDPQADDTPAERIGVRIGVAGRHAEQDAEPGPDRADDLALDRDAGLAHALHHGSHGAR